MVFGKWIGGRWTAIRPVYARNPTRKQRKPRMIGSKNASFFLRNNQIPRHSKKSPARKKNVLQFSMIHSPPEAVHTSVLSIMDEEWRENGETSFCHGKCRKVGGSEDRPLAPGHRSGPSFPRAGGTGGGRD